MLLLLLLNPREMLVQLTLNDLLLCYMVCISVSMYSVQEVSSQAEKLIYLKFFHVESKSKVCTEIFVVEKELKRRCPCGVLWSLSEDVSQQRTELRRISVITQCALLHPKAGKGRVCRNVRDLSKREGKLQALNIFLLIPISETS